MAGGAKSFIRKRKALATAIGLGLLAVCGDYCPHGPLPHSPLEHRRGAPAAAPHCGNPSRRNAGRACRSRRRGIGVGGTACGGAHGLQRQGLRAGAEAVRAPGKPGKQ